MSEFYFKQRKERLDWKTISSIDLDVLMNEVDLDTLEAITKNLTFSRIDSRELKYFSEENFVQVFQLSQLVIEYLLFCQDYLVRKRDETDIKMSGLLDELEKYKSELQRKNQEGQMLRKEVRRQKRTIFAYQLVYGANPEGAKMKLKEMRAGAPSGQDEIEVPPKAASQVPESADAFEAKMKVFQKEQQKAASKLQKESEKMQAVLQETKHMQEQMLKAQKTTQRRESSDITSTISNQLAKYHMEIMKRVDERIAEVIAAAGPSKETQLEMMRLSTEVKTVQKVLQKEIETESVDPETLDPETQDLITNPITDDQSQDQSSEDKESTKSLSSNGSDMESNTEETEVKKNVTQQSKKVEFYGEDENQAELNEMKENLREKLRRETNLPALVDEYHNHGMFKVPGQLYLRSKFNLKPENLELEREIVEKEFDNILTDIKAKRESMSDEDFVREMAKIGSKRKENSELLLVMGRVRNMIDKITLQHNPEWKKFQKPKKPKSRPPKLNLEQEDAVINKSLKTKPESKKSNSSQSGRSEHSKPRPSKPKLTIIPKEIAKIKEKPIDSTEPSNRVTKRKSSKESQKSSKESQKSSKGSQKSVKEEENSSEYKKIEMKAISKKEKKRFQVNGDRPKTNHLDIGDQLKTNHLNVSNVSSITAVTPNKPDPKAEIISPSQLQDVSELNIDVNNEEKDAKEEIKEAEIQKVETSDQDKEFEDKPSKLDSAREEKRKGNVSEKGIRDDSEGESHIPTLEEATKNPNSKPSGDIVEVIELEDPNESNDSLNGETDEDEVKSEEKSVHSRQSPEEKKQEWQKKKYEEMDDILSKLKTKEKPKLSLSLKKPKKGNRFRKSPSKKPVIINQQEISSDKESHEDLSNIENENQALRTMVVPAETPEAEFTKQTVFGRGRQGPSFLSEGKQQNLLINQKNITSEMNAFFAKKKKNRELNIEHTSEGVNTDSLDEVEVLETSSNHSKKSEKQPEDFGLSPRSHTDSDMDDDDLLAMAMQSPTNQVSKPKKNQNRQSNLSIESLDLENL